MKPPDTHYASLDGAQIAYQVVGDGPIDVVWAPSWFGHVEANWEWQDTERFLRGLASFSRLIVFDKRGTGLSDPVPLTALSVEEWMDDLKAVLDAVGSTRTALVTAVDAGALGILFASTYPDRTSALVFGGCYARFTRAPDYPWGAPPEWTALAGDWIRGHWGSLEVATRFMPNMDEEFRVMAARYQRLSASPGAAAVMVPMLQALDLRHLLPAIRVPTLVLHRTEDRYVRVEHGRYLAEHIPDAKFVELPGDQPLVNPKGDQARVLAEIEEFLTGVRPTVASDRVLATVLFTDIVDSTALALDLGDRRWREVLDAHDAAVVKQLERHRGRRIKTTGDGVLATFDGPARAILCASAIRDSVRPLGVDIRAGLHTGEIEVRDDNDIGGVAVHIAARVAALAGPLEVLVSSTVRDLVVGSGIEFDERGEHALKGVPGEWRLFAVRS